MGPQIPFLMLQIFCLLCLAPVRRWRICCTQGSSPSIRPTLTSWAATSQRRTCMRETKGTASPKRVAGGWPSTKPLGCSTGQRNMEGFLCWYWCFTLKTYTCMCIFSTQLFFFFAQLHFRVQLQHWENHERYPLCMPWQWTGYPPSASILPSQVHSGNIWTGWKSLGFSFVMYQSNVELVKQNYCVYNRSPVLYFCIFHSLGAPD